MVRATRCVFYYTGALGACLLNLDPPRFLVEFAFSMIENLFTIILTRHSSKLYNSRIGRGAHLLAMYLEIVQDYIAMTYSWLLSFQF